MKRRYFNMVEVMLAVVVISVGLASVFVLFPTGLTAHRSAAADNSIADLAEYIFSSVKAQIDIDCSGEDDEDNKKFEKGEWTKYSNTPSDASVELDDNGSGWNLVSILKKGVTSEDAVKNVSLLQNTAKKNVFWVRQVSGPSGNRYSDFSAIGRVYVDRESGKTGLEDEFFFSTDGTMKQYSAISYPNKDAKKFILPLVLEISYPAEADYDLREKKYFRFEVFNSNYEPRVI
ncbi:MAG: hypothetical protein MR051_08600 [Lentisphaeria bacterium]|nr:hypothetical protein [Lentisphaeria bacterium]